MYASVRRYEGVQDVAAAGKFVKDIFLPMISLLPGFVSYCWIDAGNGVMISTTVFNDKETAEESNRIAAATVTESMRAWLPNPPQITVGEVVVYK